MTTSISKRENGTRKVSFVCDGESMTEQSHKVEVNINSIMAKYHRTRVLPVYGGFPTYGDFSATGTYQEAVNQVLAAQEKFAALPSELRKRFANDPGKLIDFLNDPGNVREAIELGLVDAPPPAKPADGGQPGPHGSEPGPALGTPSPRSEPAAADGGTPVAASSASGA